MTITKKGPGKAFRKGMSVAEFFQMFPDHDAAEKWLVKQRWPDGICCPECGSVNVQTGAKRKRAAFRCREKVCGKQFNVGTGTFMEGAKVKYRDWVYAMYLASTNLKSVSSMKLHRDLGITQKTAWFLAHRVRRAWKADPEAAPFDGPVEVGETYFGGQEKNKHESKKLKGGRGPVGKAVVVGAKDQASNKVAAKTVDTADKPTLQSFVQDSAKPGATAYTDGNPSYAGMPGMDHEAVNHTVGEYVKGQAHTNGIESFWAVLKRAHKGTFHKLSPKHLQRYVDEFAGRHNIRDLDTIEQMRSMARAMEGGQLRYKDLTAPNGLDSGARLTV
ncbi:MAG: IS1595 family transposase [Acidobacteriia bacterium]|nr:IS1595 family transposase [Terriglobia bacterium]